ncbi:MAG TPA: hypothetical protein VKQ72_10875 [Aggregatilineales bacterium]|nr:hypothetical protein [Aggregatilineales bacterium]
MQRLWIVLFAIFLCLVVAACNANSDAVSILQTTVTSQDATIAAYENLGATVTAQATSLSDDLVKAQNDLATSRAQVRDLTARLNASAQPASISVSGGSADNTASGAAGTPQPAGLNFTKVSTSKSTDASGCAQNETTTFNMTDPSIWIVAEVNNYKRGTVFSAKWQGDNFNRQDDWTVSSDGAKLCVHFYIKPSALNLTAGSYSATISASGQTSPSVQFTIQSAAPAVTPTKAKTN